MPAAAGGQASHVQTSTGAGLAEPAEPTSRLAEGIARGAAVVAGLTIVSRTLGLVRTLVFSQTIGASCLGTAYALFYGLSVVLYGLLQSYRRFAAPSIGPGISSLVLIACYLAFVPLNKGLPLGELPLPAELVLAVGTTLGIAALAVVAVPPTWRLHLRLRPALRFPPGVARRAGGLALVGVIELVIIDVAGVVSIALANGRGQTGAIVLFNYAGQVFGTISAILALSIVTSAFPVLSAREGPDFDRTCAGSTRAALLMSWLGTAVIAAIAVPAAHVLAKQPDQVPQLIWAFALYAPGVAGAAVIANLSRVMFVIGRLKIAAAALGGSWLIVIVADVVLAELVPSRLVVGALALGTTIGQTVVAVPLVFVTRRICGAAAVRGVGHAALAGLAAGAAAAAGAAVSLAVPLHHKLEAFALAIPAACCAIIAFGVVAYVLDDGDLKSVLAWVRRTLGRS